MKRNYNCTIIDTFICHDYLWLRFWPILASTNYPWHFNFASFYTQYASRDIVHGQVLVLHLVNLFSTFNCGLNFIKKELARLDNFAVINCKNYLELAIFEIIELRFSILNYFVNWYMISEWSILMMFIALL